MIVKYNSGEACTTYSQCMADRDRGPGAVPFCGPECDEIIDESGGWGPSPTPAPTDDLSYCDAYGSNPPFWLPECVARLNQATPSPTPADNKDVKDCSGFTIPGNDPSFRTEWLGDGGCDEDSWDGFGANWNCATWG
jgi:hypothetical protein